MEDTEARTLLLDWCKPLNLRFRQDALGNLFPAPGRQRRHRATVAFGSHLDTVPTGGRFDGADSVCSPAWKRFAPWTKPAASHPAARTGELDQQGRRSLPSAMMGTHCARRRYVLGCARHYGRQGLPACARRCATAARPAR
jgi:hypothetical protein